MATPGLLLPAADPASSYLRVTACLGLVVSVTATLAILSLAHPTSVAGWSLQQTRTPTSPFAPPAHPPRQGRPALPASPLPRHDALRTAAPGLASQPLAAPLTALPRLPLLLALPAALLLPLLAHVLQRPTPPPAAMSALLGRRPSMPARRTTQLWAAQPGEPGNELEAKSKPLLEPKSPTGEFLRYILTKYPHLFEESVQNQLQLLCEAKERQADDLTQVSESSLALYKRIYEVKEEEHSRALEDILYFSVLQEFMKLGVSTIQPQQLEKTANFVHTNADRLFSMVHSEEEKEVVMAHVRKTLGPMSPMQSMFSNVTVKVFRLQAFEMFASSMIFGYFLRHTYKRFALARSLGLTPSDHKSDVALLQAIYERSSSETEDPDKAPAIENPIDVKRKPISLKQYMDKMDRSAVMDSARFSSKESSQMVQDYLTALFGDVKVLMRQIQDVVNEPTPVTTPEEYTQRMMKAVEGNKVETLEISLVDLRRLILEAVAFGTFLKDAESFVEVNSDSPLLTASKPP